MKKYHSVLEIFANFNCFVPRTLAACIVYARFNLLFAVAGRLFINGMPTGAAIGSLIGCAICFNVLNRVFYFSYGAAESKVVEARKCGNGSNLFFASMMKTVMLSIVYLYMALGIYFSFDNASYIPSTAMVGESFIAAFILDIVLIDTAFALLCSLFGKSDVRLPSEDVSPTHSAM